MQDFKKLSLDVQLSMLLDHEAAPEDKEALEARLQTDDIARRLQEKLRRGSDFGKRRFEELLKEPVPLAVVRSIKSAEPPRTAVGPRIIRPSFKLAPSGPQALAAALILFVIGCGIGYLFGIDPAAKMAPLVPIADNNSKDLLNDIAAHQRVFSRQTRHLVEVPATQREEISTWLTSAVGVAFRIPDLSDHDLELQGARLFLAGGRTVGQLMYRNTDGDIVSICFTKDSDSPDTDDFKETIKDDIGLVTWHNAGATYVVVGPSSEASLDELAAGIATLI